MCASPTRPAHWPGANRRWVLLLSLLAGLLLGVVQAADQGPLKYAEGQYETSSGMYTVVEDDDLTGIAERFGTSVPDLKAANNLGSDLVEVGQKLAIPDRKSVV